MRDDVRVRRPDGAEREPRATAGPRPTDWALAALVVLAHLTRVSAGQHEAVVAPGLADVLTPALAVGAGLPLVWRRSHRRAVAATVLVSYAGLALLEGIVAPWAPWVVIWTLATTGPDRRRSTRECAAVTLATVTVLAAAQLVHPRSGGLVLVVAVTAVVALLGVLVRTERSRVEEAGRRATVEERLRIARDLHDLVGHGLSAVAVQSSTARMAITAGDTATAERALTAVETTSRTAMREMRQMLHLLSEEVRLDESPTASDTPAVGGARPATPEGAERLPSPGVADIEALVDNVRAGGVSVTLEDDDGWASASPAVQLCAYRLAQEGLTNAVRHAAGAPVTIRLTSTGEVGVVSVRTSGPVAPGPIPVTGRGIQGLATRVAAVSGEFWSGPTPQGWLLEARLPLHAGSDREMTA